MKVKDGIVIIWERIECQIKSIDGIIAVVEASPAPVEVEHIVIVITIKHIGMTACFTLRSIIDRHARIQVGT